VNLLDLCGVPELGGLSSITGINPYLRCHAESTPAARLRWDKAFPDEPIDLARNTIGVRDVIDRRRVEPGERIVSPLGK
jgi:hypothetical protein